MDWVRAEMTHTITRKKFLQAMSAVACLRPQLMRASKAGSTFQPWRPGTMDIHHISTGRGNSSLFIFPDGTSMMVDAGATTSPLKYTIEPKPDGSRRPGEWVGRYAKRHLQAANRDAIDYFVLTHFHGDHMGEMSPEQPLSQKGKYRLTGVSDVSEIVPIRRFIDRDHPDYSYPVKQSSPSALNYIEFIRAQQKSGAIAERIQVGSGRQIGLLSQPEKFPSFIVRNLAANGEVWTGSGESTRRHFPDLKTLSEKDYPTENMCCLALRVSYGKFDYYTGGDLPGGNHDGAPPWRDIESPVARVAGPVEVAILNHHGYVDAVGAEFVRSLRPRAFILLAWDSAHPAISTLQRMLNKSLYPGDRDIFATAMKPENKIVNRRLAELKSDNGHIVLRVAPDGTEFRIVILENASESDQVIAEFGPWPCS
jgi:hypothetical protein